MRLPITDQFLWDIYKLLDTTDDILHFVFRRRRTMYDLPGLHHQIFNKYRKNNNKRTFSDIVYYLKRKGYIKVKNLEYKKAIILTKQGINRIFKASFKIENKKKRQDGKWVMLIFDVPEKYKKSRNLLTSILRNLGYRMFEQSAWITPYDVSDKTEKLLQMYDLDKFVKIFLIEELD
jgi:hypothetical protein